MKNPVSDAVCGVVLLCDYQGLIIRVLHDGLGLDSRLVEGQSLVNAFGVDPSRASAQQPDLAQLFMASLRESGYAFGWKIEAQSKGQPLSLSLTGGATNEGFLIVGEAARSDVTRLVEELMRINNETVNALRTSVKQASLTTQKNELTVAELRAELEQEMLKAEAREQRDADLLNEVSRINNELVSAQRTVRLNEERLNLTLQSAGVGTWHWNISKNSLLWDDFVPPLFGLQPSTFSGHYEDFLALVHPDDRERITREGISAVEDNAPYDTEYQVIWPDGSVHALAGRGTVYRDGDGRAVQINGVCWDISRRKQAEAALKRANDELELRVEERTAELAKANKELEVAAREAQETNQVKTEFLSRISHELRTPLNAILGFGQILEGMDLHGLQQESVAQIMQGGHNLLALVDDLMDLMQLDSDSMLLNIESLSIASMVSESLAHVRNDAAQRKIELINAVEGTSYYVRADANQLQKALRHLLDNAIKFNHEGGTVTIAVEQRKGVSDTTYVRFSITDTGPGLGAKEIAKLFTPFERLAMARIQEGTGMGLALVKRIAEAMDGRAGVESTVGQGSTFWVELPQAESPNGKHGLISSEQIAADNSVSAEKFTVLYIEDNLSNLQLVKSIMAERPSIHLLSAMRGQEGIDMARAHIPNMILLDLHLPDMSGEDVLRQLRAESATREIPIVVLSADAMPRHVAKLKAAGAKDYLTKPLNVLEFLSVLDKTLAQCKS